MDEFLKKYGDLSQLKYQVTPTDIKVINRVNFLKKSISN